MSEKLPYCAFQKWGEEGDISIRDLKVAFMPDLPAGRLPTLTAFKNKPLNWTKSNKLQQELLDMC